MSKSIHVADVNDSPALCFDTGLDPRSFARTKMSQSLIEEGYVVSPDGTHKVWKPAGVMEINNKMRVYGEFFHGKRLDLILNDINTFSNVTIQTALQAVVFWIRAKMLMGETRTAFNPGAAFVCLEDKKPDFLKGSVYFAPEHLANRCLFIEGSQLDKFNCPDLIGLDNAAFCAAVMLYKIFTGNHPYPSKDLYQDMREGIFLPVHLAAPDLDENVAKLIQSALMLPVAKKRHEIKSVDILSGLLEKLIGKESEVTAISSLKDSISNEKTNQVEREKKLFLFKQNSIVNTRRFATRNKHLLIGIGIGIFFVLFVVLSMTSGQTRRLSTEGMLPRTVVGAYYDAFSSLNHQMMEACVNGADKTDINAAVSLFAVARTRQAYELTPTMPFVPAQLWRDNGGELPSPNAFGVTDLHIEHKGGSETESLIVFQATYILWTPDEEHPRNRTDILTLRRNRRNNWQIIEILRTER